MKKLSSLACGLLLVGFSTQAQVITEWTFETSIPATAGPLAAEIGTGSALGSHAGATVYSSPAGNGSPHSFSSTLWAIGDYYQFSASSVGFTGLQLEWDQTSSNTGPGVFRLNYSTDGTTFTPMASSYTVLPNAAPNSWSSGTAITATHYLVDLSALSGLNNNPTISFRLVDDSLTSANGGTVAAGGTDRIDNFTIEVVPEPQSLCLLGMGAAAWFLRRRA